MGEPAKRRATYEDLLQVPAPFIAEIVDGVLLTQPRPASRHALAASVLGGELSGPFHRGKGGPGGWILLDEPELHLHGDVLVPDLAGWTRERMPETNARDAGRRCLRAFPRLGVRGALAADRCGRPRASRVPKARSLPFTA